MTTWLSTLESTVNVRLTKQWPWSYLLPLSANMGGQLFAGTLIKKLLCLSPDIENCKGCQSCLCFSTQSHPDCIIISADMTAQLPTIKIDTLRVGLQRTLSSPTLSRRQVLYIPDCHLMTEHCTQALLKTLEEPKYNLYLILQTPYPKQLPLTILSRVFIEPIYLEQHAIINYINTIIAQPSYRFLAYTHAHVPQLIPEIIQDSSILELYGIVMRLLHSYSWQPMHVAQQLGAYAFTTVCSCFINCLYALIGHVQQVSLHAQQLYQALLVLYADTSSMQLNQVQIDAILRCCLAASARHSRSIVLNSTYQKQYLLITIWQIFHTQS